MMLFLSSGLGCEPEDGTVEARWEHTLSGLPAALLGVWGTSEADVWTVGADPGDGPWVLRFDGTRWTRFATGQRGTLWWVTSAGPSASVWMAGEAGLVLRYDRGTDRFTKVEGVPASVTLYGILEVGGDVWAVGGNTEGGRVFELDGEAFAEVAVPAEAASAGRFFKVWGRSSSDLWVVGLGNKLLHRTGSGWVVFDPPKAGRLTTIHGNTSLAVAVGGFSSGLVFEVAASGTTDATPPDLRALNGVWVSPDGKVTAVGVEGSLYERSGTVWRTPAGLPGSLDDYHAVYVDPTGGVWAVGGRLVVEPQRDGMLLHYGPPIPGLD